MPLSDHARWRVALRTLGAVVAVASAVVAIWLIARGTDSKTIQIGVIVGLWAALLGSATLFGTRRPAASDGLRRADLDRVVEASARNAEHIALVAATEAAQGAVESLREAGAGREVELRRTSELEHERDEATRREFALSLELMLRREMERVLRDELGALRQEVAGLRNDLIEKVPGQIRLERIETTRLIGSDLEALQAEVRRLSDERVSLAGLTATTTATTTSATPGSATGGSSGRGVGIGTPATVRPAVVDPAPAPLSVPAADTRPAPAVAPVAAPEPVTAPEPDVAASTWTPQVLSEPVPAEPADFEPAEPAASEPAPVEPAPAEPAASEPAPAEPEPRPTFSSSGNADPFADLPRLTRWIDPFEGADPPKPYPVAVTEPAPVTDTAPAALDADDDGPRYIGRRRQAAEEREARAAAAAAGHHVAVAEPDTAPAPETTPAPETPPGNGSAADSEVPSGGHRRRREDREESAEQVAGGRRRRPDEPRGGHSRPDPEADDVLARLLGR